MNDTHPIHDHSSSSCSSCSSKGSSSHSSRSSSSSNSNDSSSNVALRCDGGVFEIMIDRSSVELSVRFAIKCLPLQWVTVCKQINHRGCLQHQNQLSLQSLQGRQIEYQSVLLGLGEARSPMLSDR